MTFLPKDISLTWKRDVSGDILRYRQIFRTLVPTTVWAPKAVRVQLWTSQLDHLFIGLWGLELWYGSHVWDPGGDYCDLRFLVLQKPYLTALLLNKETDFIRRLNDLWFGVEDGSHSLLDFLLFFIPTFRWRLFSITSRSFTWTTPLWASQLSALTSSATYISWTRIIYINL